MGAGRVGNKRGISGSEHGSDQMVELVHLLRRAERPGQVSRLVAKLVEGIDSADAGDSGQLLLDLSRGEGASDAAARA